MGDWFMEKVAVGEVEVPNPFNQKPYVVPLKPETTAAIVFWSKNFRPFIDKLSVLEKKGFDKFLFNFTITGLGDAFEPGIPPAEKTIEDFKYLSLKYWKSNVFWRFDPIVFTNINDEKYYLNKFRRLADEIAPYTERCIISFAFFYDKVKKSLANLSKKDITAFDPDVSRKKALALQLTMLAHDYNLELHSCCCDYLDNLSGIQPSRCIDGELISSFWGNKFSFINKPSRAGCGCAESSDIGSYGTCLSGCSYCYAQ